MDFYNACWQSEKIQTVAPGINGKHGKVQTISGTGEPTVEDIALLKRKRRARRSEWHVGSARHTESEKCLFMPPYSLGY